MFLSVARALTLELFEFHERKLNWTGVMMVLARLRKVVASSSLSVPEARLST
jgi:hypothetical protein